MKTMLLSMFIVVFIGSCNYSHCSRNSSYRNQPGICSKISRLEQAKQRYNQASIVIVYFMLGVMILPIFITLLTRMMQFMIHILRQLVGMIIKTE